METGYASEKVLPINGQCPYGYYYMGDGYCYPRKKMTYPMFMGGHEPNCFEEFAKMHPNHSLDSVELHKLYLQAGCGCGKKPDMKIEYK